MSPTDFPRIYKRHLMSRSFNWWLRRMLPIEILDTQAGLKGVTARAWQTIGPQITSEGFFFDVELLARAGAGQSAHRGNPRHGHLRRSHHGSHGDSRLGDDERHHSAAQSTAPQKSNAPAGVPPNPPQSPSSMVEFTAKSR